MGGASAPAQRAAAAPEGSFRIDAAGYARVFETARDVLRRQGFKIQRVDARAGVITTSPKPTGGLLTPWDSQQATPYAEFEDALANQRRSVRVTFEPDGIETGDPTTYDLRLWGETGVGSGTVRVHVTLERIHRPGWRVDTQSVRLATRTQDPVLRRRGMDPVYTVAFAQDPELASELAERIRRGVISR